MNLTYRGVSSLIPILYQFQPRAIPKLHHVYKICFKRSYQKFWRS